MKGILAILMAGIMMAAMVAPAMGDSATSSATVGNVAPTIEEMHIYDATPTEMTNPSANDLALAPGGTVTITVKELIEDLNGYGDIGSVVIDSVGTGLEIVETLPVAMTAGVTVGATQQWYEATLTVRYYTLPGSYTVTNKATDTAGLFATRTESFDVLATAPSITVAVMAFGPIAPGGSALSSHAVTNQGNVAVDFDDVSSDGYDVLNDEIMWDDFAGPGTLLDDDMTTGYGGEDVAVSGTHDVPFTLSVPAGTTPGAYTGTTYFTPSTV
jgi:hypothetical protein